MRARENQLSALTDARAAVMRRLRLTAPSCPPSLTAPASHEQGTRSWVTASGSCTGPRPSAPVLRPPRQRSPSFALPNTLGFHLDVPRDQVTTQKAFPVPGGVAGRDADIWSLENSEA